MPFHVLLGTLLSGVLVQGRALAGKLPPSASLSELINSYSPWNYQKTIAFLLISGEVKVNQVI